MKLRSGLLASMALMLVFNTAARADGEVIAVFTKNLTNPFFQNERVAAENEPLLSRGLLGEALRDVDDVAYVRFASVYKGFEGTEDFAREIGMLVKTTAPKLRG